MQLPKVLVTVIVLIPSISSRDFRVSLWVNYSFTEKSGIRYLVQTVNVTMEAVIVPSRRVRFARARLTPHPKAISVVVHVTVNLLVSTYPFCT